MLLEVPGVGIIVPAPWLMAFITLLLPPEIDIMPFKPPAMPAPGWIMFPVLPGVGIIELTPLAVGIKVFPFPGVGIILDVAPGVGIITPMGAFVAIECGCCFGTMRRATDCSRCSNVLRSAYSSLLGAFLYNASSSRFTKSGSFCCHSGVTCGFRFLNSCSMFSTIWRRRLVSCSDCHRGHVLGNPVLLGALPFCCAPIAA